MAILNRYYRHEAGRFALSFSATDVTLPPTLAGIEGARFDRKRQLWTMPGSLRIVHRLESLAFAVHPSFTEDTLAYVSTLVRPVANGEALVFGDRVLLPHQCAGVRWLRTRTHALLNDEQGTGKTVHAIAWAHEDELVIVCAKLVLLPQWYTEIKRMGVRDEPEYVVIRDRFTAEITDKERGWYLINPEKLHKLRLPSKPYTIIFDESSMFKNQQALRTKAALELAANAQKVLCLDGNAMPNRPIELWTTYLMLNQRMRSEFWKWAERYTGSFRTPYGWDFSGATFIDELSEDMTAFSLRREADILDLPDMMEQTVVVPRNDAILNELSIRATQLRMDMEAGVSLKTGDGLKHLQNLRVEAALAKVPYALELLLDRTSSSKVVTFSEFKGPLRVLREEFNAQAGDGRYVVKLTGDEDGEEREHNLKLFNTDAKCVGLLCTYAVGERGLNLQCADTAVILDLPWTPASLAQAKARIRRMGQKKTTEAITLMSGHPVEDLMLNALAHKQDIIDGLYTLGKRKELSLW